ncbi:T9SS type A sorting domain-containing protein [Flammeovirga agarivorans]|uniref:T9SS type A sorting domain-containing protein n=1 Tax=Flammeovirga agarivorans TaxID=2726742 RepID=A0A7X8XW46_9BACT|nr:T9SS type A sorting domain-containing protein [Flammeovirga agarivorans]NLR91952.1 T9SS type A sorting domain-containing protein [Flammeovirga agarivorans]
MNATILTRLLTLCIILLSSNIFAANISWDGDAGDGLWSTASNWDGDALPDNGDNVTLDCNCTITVNGDIEYKKLALEAGTTLHFTANSTIDKADETTIDGTMIIDAIVTFPQGIEVELTDDDAILQVNASGEITDTGLGLAENSRIEIKAEGTNTGVDEGPFIYNYGEMTLKKLDIGKDGNGELYNYSDGIINVSDELHVDGELCNQGTLNIHNEDGDAKFKVHGATISCGGLVNVDLVELDDKEDRQANLSDIVISDGNDCEGGDSDTPQYKVKDVDGIHTFNEVVLLDAGNNTFQIDPENVYSCNRNAANEDLPVELIYFEAYEYESAVELIWETASEINNSHFVLEKSQDKVNWYEITQVQGMGNSNIAMNYSFMDENPYPGVSYYRLTQVDFDGKYEMFEPIMYKNGEEVITNILAFPIPSEKIVTITSTQDILKERIQIFNSIGVSVQHLVNIESMETKHIQLNIEELKQGVYYFKTQEQIIRFVKN